MNLVSSKNNFISNENANVKWGDSKSSYFLFRGFSVWPWTTNVLPSLAVSFFRFRLELKQTIRRSSESDTLNVSFFRTAVLNVGVFKILHCVWANIPLHRNIWDSFVWKTIFVSFHFQSNDIIYIIRWLGTLRPSAG